MTNILIKDLEVSEELDKKAMANIFGGNDWICTPIWSGKISEECVGTVIEDGEIKRKIIDTYERIDRCLRKVTRTESVCIAGCQATSCQKNGS